MKFTSKLLIVLIALSLIPLAIATVTYTLNNPGANYQTTSTSITFNWTPSTDGLVSVFPSYFYLTNSSNETQFLLNETILYCTNSTDCNLTIDGFTPGFYQWKVITGEDATQPQIVGINAAPWDTSDRAGNVTSSNAGTYDTSDRYATITGNESSAFLTDDGNNVTLLVNYTNNSASEFCNMTFADDNGLSISNITTEINNACNLTASGAEYLTLTTPNAGANEFIYVQGGNGTKMLGLDSFVGVNTTGSVNNTFDMQYTIAGATENCNVTLTKNATLLASEALTNITQICNVTGTEVSNYLNLNTNSTGADAWMYFDRGNVLGILGFTAEVNYSGSVNNTVDLTYTVNGTSEDCNVSFTKNKTLLADEAITNFTQASAQCNLTFTNTTFLTITGSGYGEGESLSVDRGSSTGILGISGTSVGTQINTTSDSRWFEIQDGGSSSNYTLFSWQNDSGFEAMTLNKDTGDLWIAGNFNYDGDLNITGNIDMNSTGTAYNITGLGCIEWNNGAVDCGT